MDFLNSLRLWINVKEYFPQIPYDPSLAPMEYMPESIHADGNRNTTEQIVTIVFKPVDRSLPFANWDPYLNVQITWCSVTGIISDLLITNNLNKDYFKHYTDSGKTQTYRLTMRSVKPGPLNEHEFALVFNYDVKQILQTTPLAFMPPFLNQQQIIEYAASIEQLVKYWNLIVVSLSKHALEGTYNKTTELWTGLSFVETYEQLSWMECMNKLSELAGSAALISATSYPQLGIDLAFPKCILGDQLGDIVRYLSTRGSLPYIRSNRDFAVKIYPTLE